MIAARPTRVKESLGLAIAVCVLGGCATLPVERRSKTERVCIDRREISSISALDDRHAFVKRGSGHYSLLTLDERCTGLALARTLAIEGSAPRVCGGGGSLLSFDSPAVGLMRCRVERIEPVQDRSTALELIESRAAPE